MLVSVFPSSNESWLYVLMNGEFGVPARSPGPPDAPPPFPAAVSRPENKSGQDPCCAPSSLPRPSTRPPNPNPPRAAAASQFEIGVSDKGVIYGKLQFRQKMQQWVLLRVEPREWQSLQLE